LTDSARAAQRKTSETRLVLASYFREQDANWHLAGDAGDRSNEMENLP